MQACSDSEARTNAHGTPKSLDPLNAPIGYFLTYYCPCGLAIPIRIAVFVGGLP